MLILLPRGSLLTVSAPMGWLRHFLPGLLLGVCMLIRPMYLLFSPFAVAILFLEERQWIAAMRRSAYLGAGCLLIVLPWSTYVSLKAGTPLLISANGGETLSGGLNPVLIDQGYQFYSAPNGRQVWFGPGNWLNESESGYLDSDEQNLPYAQRDILLRQRTMTWVLQNPGSALYLEGAKLLYMWGFYPFWNGPLQSIFGNVPTIVFIMLSIMSLVRFRTHIRQLSRLWLLPIFASFVALVSWGSWRFRQPGDLGLIMLGALFLWSTLEDYRGWLKQRNLPWLQVSLWRTK
jgi:hypothetical protein